MMDDDGNNDYDTTIFYDTAMGIFFQKEIETRKRDFNAIFKLFLARIPFNQI